MNGVQFTLFNFSTGQTARSWPHRKNYIVSPSDEVARFWANIDFAVDNAEKALAVRQAKRSTKEDEEQEEETPTEE